MLVSDARKILFMAMLFLLPPVYAEEAEQTPDILIRNVHLIENADAEGDGPQASEEPIVNILISNRKLDIITRDPIPIDDLTLTVNAEGAFLLGRLQLGERPNFLILDSDPRTDFDVLLDTDKHTRFAVSEGEIVRNQLLAIPEFPEDEKPTEQENTQQSDSKDDQPQTPWLAYTPVPMMLPSGYRDGSKWNRWESKAISGIFVGALALDRMRWTSQDDTSEAQVGDVKEFDGGVIRGLRFGVIGTLNFAQPWVYTVFAATNAFDNGFDESGDDDFQWFDYRLDIPLYKGTTLSIGKQKEPISMERLTPMTFISMQERAAPVDAMLPARNTGIVLSGGGLNERMTWAVGGFNNSLEGDESFSNAASQVVGRVTAIPVATAGQNSLLHLGLGMRYSNGNEGVRYFTEPEFAESPVFIDTGDINDSDSATTVDLEVSWRTGPLWLSSEWIKTDVESATAGDPTFDGYYVAGVWALTGETRQYNTKAGLFMRPPVKKSVYENGIGAWELLARYSSADMTDGNVVGGDMDIASAGIRWWLTPFFMVDLNYRYITLTDALGNGHSSGVNARLFLSLE
jgi:phosphate-selective porin OprO/OprP